MNTRCLVSWLASSTWLAAVLAAPGATPSHEPFDYPDGTAIANQNGGVGWTAAGWTAPAGNGTITVRNVSLTYPGILSSGGKMHFEGVPLTGTTSVVSYRSPTNALTTGTHYIRFIGQNLNEGRRYFGLGLFDAGTERALLGQASGSEYWTLNRVDGVTNAMFTNMLVSAVDTSDPALLVLKLEMQAGATPERVTFWVNPDLSQPESAATAVGGASFMTDRDFGQITRVRIGGGGYSATAGGDPTDHYMDEIEISPISPFANPSLACTNSGGIVSLAWPPEYVGWTLQTNAAGLGDVPAWGDVENTSSITATNLPVDPADPAVFYRLRSP
jgi:hypothetical protein